MALMLMFRRRSRSLPSSLGPLVWSNQGTRTTTLADDITWWLSLFGWCCCDHDFDDCGDSLWFIMIFLLDWCLLLSSLWQWHWSPLQHLQVVSTIEDCFLPWFMKCSFQRWLLDVRLSLHLQRAHLSPKHLISLMPSEILKKLGSSDIRMSSIWSQDIKHI